MKPAILLLAWCALCAPARGDDGPLRVRNLLPAAQLYGLPRPLGARLPRSGLEVTLNTEIANNFSSTLRSASRVFYDGETLVTSLGFRRAFADGRMELGAELPYVVHHGGVLDGFIDGFHDLFGFTDGGRSLAPRDRLDYLVRIDGVTYASFQRSRKHLGDVRAWLGYQLAAGAERALAARVQLKLPTGNVGSLSGSGAADVAAWLEYADRRLLRGLGLELSLMGGLAALGEGDLAPDDQHGTAGFAHLGLQYVLNERVRFHAQLDAHTELLATGIDQAAGLAVLGTLGGRLHLGRFWLDLGVVEDLRAQSAPDVVFHIQLGARW